VRPGGEPNARALQRDPATAGERGVDRAAEILSRELRRTIQLLGTRTIDELGPQHVKLP
jgi:isopentenyl diphosphate isomerase/L-lactate dehydrogenase-like FMN-dependent dehydrogenase